MFRARERGMSFWPFAVSLLLVIVLVIMWFDASGKVDTFRQSAQAAQARADQADADRKATIAQLNKISTSVGFTGAGGQTDPQVVEGQIKEYGGKIRETLTMSFPTSRYTQEGEGGQVTKTEGDVVTVTYLTESEIADATTMQAFLSKFETAARRMKVDIDRAFQAVGQAVAEKEGAVKAHDETLRAKDTRIAELTSEKSAVESQKSELERDLKDQLAQAKAQKEKVEQDFEQARKVASENESKLVAQIGEAQGQIKSLVQREAPVLSEGPDGEVVVAENGMAIVNRGRAHWLMPGTVFDVWGIAKGGAKYKKGAIKVTTTDNESSRAVILEEANPRDPINRGDLIQSLTYSPNRKLHFVLVGDFKKMGRSQAEALLTKLGAVVDPKVTSETYYVVQGTGENIEESDAIKAAKDLGIRIITEEQFASFTRY